MKYMMKRKMIFFVEKLVVSNKIVRKHYMFKVKEVQKILQWKLLNTNGRNKPIWRGFLTFSGLHQEKTCWRSFLRTWEAIKKGIMQIFIDQISIHKQLGISFERMVNAIIALIKEVEVILKRVASSNAFAENE